MADAGTLNQHESTVAVVALAFVTSSDRRLWPVRGDLHQSMTFGYDFCRGKHLPAIWGARLDPGLDG